MIINKFVPETGVTGVNKLLTNGNSQVDNKSGEGESFLDTLKAKLNEVNDKQVQADDSTAAFVSGDNISIDQVMMSTEEAKMSLEMAVQVRNKIVEAYQELNRMQL